MTKVRIGEPQSHAHRPDQLLHVVVYGVEVQRVPGKSEEAGDDLMLLLEEWELGIRKGSQRTRPLWQLEFDMRMQPTDKKWRLGNKMSKQVQQRKLLIYAILRTAGHYRPDVPLQPDVAKAACASISAARIIPAGGSRKHSKVKLMTLNALSVKLMEGSLPGFQKVKVDEFETEHFGWPKHQCQTKGNPRHRRQVSSP